VPYGCSGASVSVYDVTRCRIVHDCKLNSNRLYRLVPHMSLDRARFLHISSTLTFLG